MDPVPPTIEAVLYLRSHNDYRLNTSLYRRFGLLLWRQEQSSWFLPAASPNIDQISARLQST